MKGIVFNVLQEFVEQNVSYIAWDNAISTLSLPSNGVYISADNYNDEELFSLVGYFCEHLTLEPSVLVRQFGEFLFASLIEMAPAEAQNATDLRTFLNMVEHLIHVEVLKLYHDANLPSFDYPKANDNELIMIYRSPRKLCFLSEGLILSAAKHFKEQVKVTQSQCMHQGADCCQIHVEFL
ncbi:heme NO-binding domain-containing protein [Algibacillus agarilyticus]|uniref:heme NO-binding domain-containing protein n=1 Tax=Algibacillus agarilyticus TaxID=2234133 RepID=UPI0013001F4C|nr:heme NO-binding domain-containing protein [Algibacillus agarilyticus]